MPCAPYPDAVLEVGRGEVYDVTVDGSRDVNALEEDLKRVKALGDMEREAKRERRGYWEGVVGDEEEDEEKGFLRRMFNKIRGKSY